jgi:hypothetical protein
VTLPSAFRRLTPEEQRELHAFRTLSLVVEALWDLCPALKLCQAPRQHNCKNHQSARAEIIKLARPDPLIIQVPRNALNGENGLSDLILQALDDAVLERCTIDSA